MLSALRARCAGVEVQIEELPAAVETGEVDVSFAARPLPEGPFAVREPLDDRYVLVTQAGSPERDLGGRRLLGIRGCRHTRAIELVEAASEACA